MAQVGCDEKTNPFDKQKSELTDGSLGPRSSQPSAQKVRNRGQDFSSSSALPVPPSESLHQREISVPHFTSIQDLVEKYQDPALQKDIVRHAKEVVRRFTEDPNKSEEMIKGMFPLIFLKNKTITRGLLSALLQDIESKPLRESACYEVFAQVIACDLVYEVLTPQDLVEGLEILVGKLNTVHVQEDQKELPQLSAALSVIEVMAEMGVSQVSKKGIKDPVYKRVNRFSQEPYSIRIRHLAFCCEQALTAIKSDEKKGQMVRRKIAKALSAVTRTGIFTLRVITGEKLLEMVLSLADAGWGGAGDVNNILEAFREAIHRKTPKEHWYEMALLFDEAFLKVRSHKVGWGELLKQIKDKNWRDDNWKLLYNLVQNWRDTANDPQASHQKEALEMLDCMFRDKAQWGAKSEIREGVLQALIEICEQGPRQVAKQACEILKALRRDYLNKVVEKTKRPTKSSRLVKKYIPEEATLESMRDQPRPDPPKTTEADNLLQEVQRSQEMRGYPQRMSRQIDGLQQSVHALESSQKIEAARNAILKRIESLRHRVDQIPQQTVQDFKEHDQALGVQISELHHALTSRQVDQEIVSQLQTLTQTLQTFCSETGAMQADLKAEIQQWTQEVQALKEARQAELEVASRIFQVPSLPKDFTGREKALQDLHTLLQKHYVGAITQGAITGLGGIGKTTLAKAYAYLYGKEYQQVWWFRAQEDLAIQYQQLGKEMGLEVGSLNPVEAAEKVRYALSQQSSWLLIFDNVGVPDSLFGQLPQTPEEGGGHVLITSRDSRWPDPLPLRSLQKTEAVELLSKQIKGASPEQLQTLAQELEYFPLALKQASSYIASQHGLIDVDKYLKLYRKRKKQLSSKDAAPSDYMEEKGIQEATVEAVMQLNFEAVKQENPKAMDLLRLCAYVGAEAIPRVILEKWSQKANAHVASCLNVLKKYSLLEFDSQTQTASIHRMVQKFAREEVAQQPREELGMLEKFLWSLEIIATALGVNLPVRYKAKEESESVQQWLDDTVLDAVLGGFEYSEHDLATWPLAKALAPHVKEVLAHGDQARVRWWKKQAVGHTTLGNFLSTQGNLEGAKAHYQKTLEILKDHYGEDTSHPDLIRTYNELGVLLKLQGDLEGAKEYYQKAWDICQKNYRADAVHLDLARTHNELGILLKTQDDLEGAERYYKRALEIYERYYGADRVHPHLAGVHNDLGVLYRVQGDLKRAKEHCQKVLDICIKHYGVDAVHPHLAAAHNNMGLLLKIEGDLEGAKVHYLKSLEISQTHYGVGVVHPHVAIAYTNLGILCLAQNNLKRAQEHLEKALEIFEEHYGTKAIHTNLALVRDALARLFHAQGDQKRAQVHFKAAARTVEQHYRTKATHSEVLALHKQGLELEAKEELEPATSQYQQALRRAEEIYGEDSTDPDLIIGHTNLSRAFCLQNKWAQAEVPTRKALAILEQRVASIAPAAFPRIYSPHHTFHLFQQIYLYRQLGELLLAQGQEVDPKKDPGEIARLHTEAEQAFAQARELDPLKEK